MNARTQATENLWNAIEYNKLSLVKMSVKDGANLGELRNGKTAILYACEKGYFEIVACLAQMKRAEFLKRTDVFCYSEALFKIIESDTITDEQQVACVKALIEAGTEINFFFHNGEQLTPLTLAIRKNKKNIISLLLSLEASTINLDNCTKTCELILNDPELDEDKVHEYIRIILLRDYSINKPDDNGNTLLHLAMMAGKRKIIELLLSDYSHMKPDFSLKNKQGKKPLELLDIKQHFNLINDLFLSNKKYHSSNFGYSSILFAMIQSMKPIPIQKENSTEIVCNEYTLEQYNFVHRLLKAGAMPNVSFGAEKDTALHLVVENNQPELVGLLLSYCKNSHINNQKNQLPKDINPACFEFGWEVSLYNRYIFNIAIVLVQAQRQPESILYPVLIADIGNSLLKGIVGGFILNKETSFTGVKEKIKTLRSECEARKIMLERVISFVTEYENPTLKELLLPSSTAAKELVIEFKKENNSLPRIHQHIHTFFGKKSVEEINKSRAVRLLLKHKLVTPEKVEKYKEEKSEKGPRL